jgi:hypothetical protein
MRTLTTTSPRQRPRPAPADSALPTRLVAVEALLLRPLDGAGPVTTIVDPGPWPVFVIVLDDPATLDPGARPLFDLLDSSHGSRISIVNSHYRWSVDPAGAVLKLAVRAHQPTRFDVEIVMPAQPALGILSLLPPAATFAITTRRRADKLTERVAIRDALHEMVLLVSATQSGIPGDGLATLRQNGQPSAEQPSRDSVGARSSDLCHT